MTDGMDMDMNMNLWTLQLTFDIKLLYAIFIQNAFGPKVLVATLENTSIKLPA